MSHLKTTELNSLSAPASNTPYSFSADSSVVPSTQPPPCHCPTGQEQGGGCVEAPLVSITKCDSTQAQQGLTGAILPQVNADTGEVILYRLVGEGLYRRLQDRSEYRLEKWELLDSVQQFLEGHRTGSCMRFPCWKPNVELLRCGRNCCYSGLMTCSSIWNCPVCATRITEGRRNEVYMLVERHLATGGVVKMLTRTVPHGREDDLRVLMDKFRVAEKRFKGGARAKRIRDQSGLIGHVRGLEVTWGPEYFWHPHTHTILLFPQELDWGWLQREYFELWCNACVQAGFKEPHPQGGLQLTEGRVYVAKWGLDYELTKSHCKRSKDEGYTPWDLLRWYRQAGSAEAAALFQHYADVFKGQRQLFWSRGLKGLYGIGQRTDQEIADAVDSSAVLVCKLSPKQWFYICKHKARGAVLVLAEQGGREAVMHYVHQICPD